VWRVCAVWCVWCVCSVACLCSVVCVQCVNAVWRVCLECGMQVTMWRVCRGQHINAVQCVGVPNEWKERVYGGLGDVCFGSGSVSVPLKHLVQPHSHASHSTPSLKRPATQPLKSLKPKPYTPSHTGTQATQAKFCGSGKALGCPRHIAL
jgi:hypothetical protein